MKRAPASRCGNRKIRVLPNGKVITEPVVEPDRGAQEQFEAAMEELGGDVESVEEAARYTNTTWRLANHRLQKMRRK